MVLSIGAGTPVTLKRRSTTWAAWCVAVLALPGWAQSPGRRLHREIPGDLGLGEMPAGALTPPESAQELAASGGRGHYDESQRPGEELLRPQDNWSSTARTMDRDTHSRPGEELSYREVFNPAVSPFKRTHAYDAVDEAGRLVVRDPSLRPMPVDAPAAWGSLPAARFTGDVFIELSPQSPTPVPSVAGEQRVVSYRTVPETTLGFFEDSAGNLFVRARVAELRRVRLAYVLEAPQRAFVPTHLPEATLSTEAAHLGAPAPLVPDFLRAGSGEVLQRVGLGANASMAVGVARLAGYFRAFRDDELPGNLDGQTYRVLALGGVGACRHRAYAFALTLHALGVNARYVGNEAHAWAEVAIPGRGWARVDLGGWDVPLRSEASSDREAFVPDAPDPLPRPPGYGEMYSSGAAPPRSRHGRPDEEPGAAPTDPAQVASGDAGTLAAGDGATVTAGAPSPDGTGPAVATASGGAPGTTMGAGGTPGEPAAGATAAALATAANPNPAAPSEALREDPSRGEPEVARVGTTLRVTSVRGTEEGDPTGALVRGRMIEVTGEAQEESGAPAANLPVTFELWRGGRAVLVERGVEPTTSLGTTVTGEDGRYSARVLLPVRLEWGPYELRARSSGDVRRLPSRSD